MQYKKIEHIEKATSRMFSTVFSYKNNICILVIDHIFGLHHECLVVFFHIKTTFVSWLSMLVLRRFVEPALSERAQSWACWLMNGVLGRLLLCVLSGDVLLLAVH